MFGLTDIRPGDRRPLLAGFVLLTAITTGHAVLETARDTLFLSRLPASALPWAYFGIAALSLLITRLTWPSGGRAPRDLSFVGLVGAAAGVTTLIWLVAAWSSPVVPILIYTWTGVVATTLLPRFWLALADVVTPAQAKRLYALIGAGSLVGATLGSLAAGALLNWISARGLLLVGAAMIGLSGFLVPLVAKAKRAEARPRRAGRQKVEGSAQMLTTQPYLRRLLLLSLATTATVTVVDYVFKSKVAADIPAAELGHFFANTYAALNGIALVAQFALAPALLRGLGAVGALVVLPALCAAGASVFIASGRLWPVLAAKVADGALRNSLARAGAELLMLPVPPMQRARWKPITDALGTRGGQALASLAILICVALGAGLKTTAIITIVLAGLWIISALDLRPRYVALFRGALRLDGGRGPATIPTDLRAIETMVGRLSSPDDAQVIAAMDLLADSGKSALIPTPMILHPSTEVMRCALRILSRQPERRPTLARAATRLLRHPDAEVRAISLAVRAFPSENGAGAACGEAELEHALEDPAAAVRATAIVCLARGGRQHPGAWAAAKRIGEEGTPAEQIQLAHAVADYGDPPLLQRFLDTVTEARPAVLREVARAARSLPNPALLPRLIAMLAYREARAEARLAILAIGPVALDDLEKALFAEGSSAQTRRHLPRTISLFATARAAAMLSRRLPIEEHGGVRFKILRALGRIRGDHPDVALDEPAIFAHAERTVARTLQLIGWRLALDGANGEGAHDLLIELLNEKTEHSRQRLFRILGLLYPRDELRAVYTGLRAADAIRRDAGAEVLAAVLSGPLRKRVLNLVDDLPDAERLERADITLLAPDAALAAMAADHSFALRALVGNVAKPTLPAEIRIVPAGVLAQEAS